MAALADVEKRGDNVAAAADPVSARKLRRDNADMNSSHDYISMKSMMRRAPPFRKPPMKGAGRDLSRALMRL